MINLANFQITGRIGDVQHFEKVTRVTIATDYQSKDNDGSWVTNTSWLTVVVFSESLRNRFNSKAGNVGNLIQVTGHLKTNKYDKDCHTIYTTDLVATDMALLLFAKDKDNDNNNDDIPY